MPFEFDNVEFLDTTQARRHRRIRILQWTLAAVIALTGPAIMWYRYRDVGWDKFDPKQWEVGASTIEASERGSRSRMVPDLMVKYIKPGMITRKQIRALLGAPEVIESTPIYEYKVAKNQGFRLGFDRDGYLNAVALVRH